MLVVALNPNHQLPSCPLAPSFLSVLAGVCSGWGVSEGRQAAGSVQLPGLNWFGGVHTGSEVERENEEPGGRFVAFTLYMKGDKTIQSICTTKIQQYIQKGCSGGRSLSLRGEAAGGQR